MTVGAASGESFGAGEDRAAWLSPLTLHWRGEGNGDPHDKRKRFDADGNLSSGSSGDSPRRDHRRRAHVRTGTDPGDGGRRSAGSASGCCGSVAATDCRRRNHLRCESKHQLHERLFRGMQFLRLWTRARSRGRILALFRGSGAPRARGLGARRTTKHAIPEMHVHAFSPMEIDYGVAKTGMALRDYLRMMKDEGLGSIPGTAAEILD